MKWKNLMMPKQMMPDAANTDGYGKFVIEPLERGFGTTLGNSLRRVLLSSLQGASITAVRMDGVLHEFSTLPGVIEDVTEIILNLKQVRLKLHGDGPKKGTFELKGKGEMRAGDLQVDKRLRIQCVVFHLNATGALPWHLSDAEMSSISNAWNSTNNQAALASARTFFSGSPQIPDTDQCTPSDDVASERLPVRVVKDVGDVQPEGQAAR